jgi:hypothetical protein
LFSVKRAKLFLSLAVVFAALGFFTLFAPIAQEVRTAPAVATYQTETPYTSTSTLEAVSTTASTKTAGRLEDAVGDAYPPAADIVSVQFEKASDFLKMTFRVAGGEISPDIIYVVHIDVDGDDAADFAVVLLTTKGCAITRYDRPATIKLEYEVDGATWISRIPHWTISNAVEFGISADTYLAISHSKSELADSAPDVKFGKVVVYSESTQTVTHYLETTLALTSTFTTSSTYNSTYTVNVPVKQGVYIAPILFIAAVAVAALTLYRIRSRPVALPKPKPEPKPPTGETSKFCLECGA